MEKVIERIMEINQERIISLLNDNEGNIRSTLSQDELKVISTDAQPFYVYYKDDEGESVRINVIVQLVKIGSDEEGVCFIVPLVTPYEMKGRVHLEMMLNMVEYEEILQREINSRGIKDINEAFEYIRRNTVLTN